MLIRGVDAYIYRFSAMASPCEVLVDTDEAMVAERIGRLAETEALRIERKFSRYRNDSVVAAINCSGIDGMELDSETANLIDYAAHCHQLSGGLFDITSGVLRKVWRFDGSDRVPSPDAVDVIMPFVGWSKVAWRNPHLALQPGMEIDLGGLGKEYAVDQAAEKILRAAAEPTLVNFGGDLRATKPRRSGRPWRAAIESVDAPSSSDGALDFFQGALATSGDARRFLLKDGVRYSHILDPRTGWPVKDPPRSVTVAGATCMEAGLLSTLAMLQGEHAEGFLKTEGVRAWVAR